MMSLEGRAWREEGVFIGHGVRLVSSKVMRHRLLVLHIRWSTPL